jgi:hypothetical protein
VRSADGTDLCPALLMLVDGWSRVVRSDADTHGHGVLYVGGAELRPEAPLLGALKSLVICLGVGHGRLLHRVVAPHFPCRGDDDPFFYVVSSIFIILDPRPRTHSAFRLGSEKSANQ